MDAIIISRVSDAHQLEGYSLAEQEREGKRYAGRKGMSVVRIFTFQETASKHHQRKAFDDILRFITNYTGSAALAVVAEKHDRLYRNHANKVVLQGFVEDGKIELHLYKEGKTLTKDSPPSDFLVDDVMTSVNQYQARNIGREAKKGMLGKAREGWFPHRAPYGYINTFPNHREDKNRRRGIIEPAIWGERLIPRMYELRAGGASLGLVRSRVIAENLVPAERVARFGVSLVEKILKSPFYKGEFIWAGERFQGKHTPLVSTKMWDAVQETFVSKAVLAQRIRKHRGALAGFLRCACGCQVTYDQKVKPSGRRYDYYRCANGKKIHQTLHSVTESHLFEQFKPAVDAITITDQLAREISDALNETQNKARKAHQRNIDDLKARHREMENAEDRLYDDLKEGLLDEPGYKRQLSRVRAERQRLADVLGEAQSEVTDAAIVTAKKILELAKCASDLYQRQTPEKRRHLLNQLLSNPVLDGLTVRFELKRPLRILSEMASSPTWGG